ncbi:MAG: acyl-CoA thioesterase [Desulfobacterales bacterium]|nr:acyl-CoA thioesterase [Desulfobacterales bacterium]
MIRSQHHSYEILHRVPFYDVDPIQIVWHGNYFKYFENARAALFANLGVDLFEFYTRTQCLFPITKTSTKHIYPLRCGDEFICKATVVEGKIKIVVDFEIRLKSDGKLCTRGRTEQIAVQAPEMEILFAIPDEISKALGF